MWNTLLVVIFCPSCLIFLASTNEKYSYPFPRYIQVSRYELFACLQFNYLVFVILGMNSLNSSGGLGISSQSEEFINLIAGACVLFSEPVFLFINKQIRKKHPVPLRIPCKTVRRYFSEEVSQEEIETTIQQALKLYFSREV